MDDKEKRWCVALAVCLMDHTFERIGNSQSASDGHFGVSGWRAKHFTVKGETAMVRYVGKSGVKHEKVIDDPLLLRALRVALKNKDPEDEVCGGVTAEDVNTYLEPFDVTAKDMRGFHANREMQERLKAIRKDGPELPRNRKEKDKILKKEFKDALEGAAEAVGHEPSTLRSQYLVPGLETAYMKDGTVIDDLTKKASDVLARVHMTPGMWVAAPVSELDVEQREEVWEVYSESYRTIGMHVSGVNGLLAEFDVLWCINVDDDPYIDAFIGYKKTPFGNKMVLSGTDGSRQAKVRVLNKIKELINSRGWYGEGSGKIAQIMEAAGARLIDDEALVRTVLSKPIEWLGDGHYRRAIKGLGMVEKALYGSPIVSAGNNRVASKLYKASRSSSYLEDPCPVCGIFANSSCRCFIGDRWCPNDHHWFPCPVHDISVVVPDGVNTHAMGIGFDECLCDKFSKVAASPPRYHRLLIPEGQRVFKIPQKPIRVWRWVAGEPPSDPRPVYGRNAQIEDEGHDWKWRNGIFRYSGSGNTGDVWLLLQYGEAEATPCLSCGRHVPEGSTFCAFCGSRIATKTPGEKEDEAAEGLLHKSPKEKPPRHDLRKQHVDIDNDSDLNEKDPDLSMNYKDIGASNRIAERWLTSNTVKHRPGDVWQTDSGNWRAKNKAGEVKSYQDEDAANTWAKGGGREGTPSEDHDAPDINTPADPSDEDDEQDIVNSNPSRDASGVTKRMVDALPRRFGKPSDKLRKQMEIAMRGVLPDDYDAAVKAFTASIEQMSKDPPSTADAVKAGRLALSKEPFGSPADIGEHLAHAIYAEHVTFNPLMLGGKHVESDPTPAEGNAKKYKERAVESYKFYQQLKTEERKLAASILQKRLLEISPESKEAEEINAIYNGIYLAAIKDGEEIEGRPPPSAEIRGLYNVLAQTGNETDLLGTVSDLSEPSNYAKIIQTYGKLPMAAFNEVVGGEKGPYSGIVKALSARSPSGGSALHPDKQNFLKQIAAELMMDSVLLADPVLHSRNGDVATPEERRMFRDRAVQESQEAQGAMDDLIENLGNLTDLDDPDVEVLRNGVRDIWRNAQRDAINNAFPDRTETPTSAEAALEGDLPIEDVGHARVNPPLVPPVERTASWIHGYSLIPWNI